MEPQHYGTEEEGDRWPSDDEPASSGTQALDRAVQLVSSVVQANEPLSFAELQESSGLAKSTTSRMLAALERGGLLERDDSGGYVAGSLFWLYAARHDPWEELVRLARPVMEQVGDDTQEIGAPLGDPRRPGRPGRPGRLALPARDPRLDRDRRTRPHLGPGQGLPRLGRARPARRPAGQAHARDHHDQGRARTRRRRDPQSWLRRHRRRARGGPDRHRRPRAWRARRRRGGPRDLRADQPPLRPARRARPRPDHPCRPAGVGAARTHHHRRSTKGVA